MTFSDPSVLLKTRINSPFSSLHLAPVPISNLAESATEGPVLIAEQLIVIGPTYIMDLKTVAVHLRAKKGIKSISHLCHGKEGKKVYRTASPC